MYLNDGSYLPYLKPNNTPRYVNVNSNHPVTVIRSETDQLEVYFLSPTFASFYGFITPFKPSLKSSLFSNLNISLPLQLLTHVVILVSSFYHAFLFIIAII